MLVWKAHKAKVRSLSFSPDGRYVITTSGHSRFVWQWEATTGELVRKLSGRNDDSARIAVFFPDGKHVAATQEHGGGWICNAETGALVTRFRPDDHDPDALAVSPEGTRLFTCSSNTVHEWTNPTAHDARHVRQPDKTYPMSLRSSRRIGFSPQGKYFCGAEWKMHLCNPDTLELRRRLDAPVGNANASAFAFTPDETRLIVAFGHSSAIWQLDDPNAHPVRCGSHGNLVRAVGFLPGGGTVLSAAMDGTVRLWDSTTGAETRSFDWGIGKVQTAAVSPDGMLCAAGSDSGQIVVWDVDA